MINTTIESWKQAERMEDNMVKLDEILEAVKYKEAAKKKEEKISRFGV